MYIVGYFSLDLNDGLGWGYGYYNFNLNSFFNPAGATYTSDVIWSTFFSKRALQNGEMEGLSYLGLSGFIFLILFIFNMFYKKNHIIYSNKKIIVICLIFLILATSNNINFDETNILKIPLHNIFYAILSTIRASGRLIWPFYYLIFIVGIILIYQYFNKKKSFSIIIILIFVQVLDLSKGLSKYKFGEQYKPKNNQTIVNDNIDCVTMKLPEQNEILNIFIDNVNNGINDVLNFRQINGEIKIVYNEPYVTFHISGEMYECEFTVVKNDALIYALNFIKK